MTQTTQTTNEAAAAFFAALFPREQWTVSEWAEKAPRVLSDEETSEPGPWRNDRTPYLVGIVDKLNDPYVEEVDTLKGAQIGYSEGVRNAIGFWVDFDPGPCLALMPDQLSAEAWRDERIEPLLRHTPAVARHLSGSPRDQSKHRIRFDTMSLYVAWAGSSQGTKTRPIRYLVLEEPDEYPPESGAGGDPISKALKRITTYADKGRAKVLCGGTPTTRTGNINKRHSQCGAHYAYWVPCPACGTYQTLKWSGVKWPKLDGEHAEKAAQIEDQNLAWYECEHCKAQVHDHQKPDMLRRGRWACEGQIVTNDGQVVGQQPRTKRVGFAISSLYSPWVGLSTLASEWLKAQGDAGMLRDFINQRLAEPFEEITGDVKAGTLERKAAAGKPAMTAPSWAQVLIATADTQGESEETGYFYYTIRAWAPGWKSQLVDFGVAHSKEELRELTLDARFPVEGHERPIQPKILVIDSQGGRTQEIYGFYHTDQHHIRLFKGANRPLRWMAERRFNKEKNVIYWEIDTQQTKDQLHLLIHSAESVWELNDRISDDYLRQMSAERKVVLRNGREVWQPKTEKAANHFWDCEAMQVGAAWLLNMNVPPVRDSEQPQPAPAPPPQQKPADSKWLGDRSAWGRDGKSWL